MTPNPDDHATQQNRREMLAKGVAGGLALVGASLLPRRAMAEDPTPGMTEGPYWVDELLFRSNITTDPSTGAVALGFPLRLTINVSQLDANGNPTPLPNAMVDIWHCNALGIYSDEAAQNTLGMKFLRGYQLTDRRGSVRFTTIYPGWYSGRTVHIHVRVRVYDRATDTVTYNQVSQFFFDDKVSDRIFTLAPYNQHFGRDTYNAADNIYAADSDLDDVEDGDELLLTLSAKQDFAVATYNFYLDLANGNGNGDDQGGGGGPPGGGGTPPDGGGGPPPGGGGGGMPPDGGGGPPPGGGGGPPPDGAPPV